MLLSTIQKNENRLQYIYNGVVGRDCQQSKHRLLLPLSSCEKFNHYAAISVLITIYYLLSTLHYLLLLLLVIFTISYYLFLISDFLLPLLLLLHLLLPILLLLLLFSSCLLFSHNYH